MTADRFYRYADVRWEGRQLRLLSGRLLATVERDREWPTVYRVHFPDGRLTDLVNLTRAKDAAVALALASLNATDRVAA
jgi:hypothetical protein